MKAGNMVRFKAVKAGHLDDPPFSQHGLWRIGLLIDHDKVEKQATIMYRNELLVVPDKNAQRFGKRYFESTERELYEER